MLSLQLELKKKHEVSWRQIIPELGDNELIFRWNNIGYLMYFYPFLLCNYATSFESKTLMSNFEPNEEYDVEIGQIKNI